MINDKEKALNLILCGPPGTGKTYNVVPHAMAIINNEPLNVWKEKLKNNKAEVLKQYRAEIEKSEYNRANGKWYKTGQIEFITFHQSYNYEEFIEGIKPELNASDLKYKLADGVFKDFCKRAKDNKALNYVFIIDEINRGNVSKIFGELITLIEPTKRLGAEEELKCTLPYSGEKFGVPENVYILGTMNTADRSLVQLDEALRRRFDFEEMMPDYEVIQEKIGKIDGVDVAKLLEKINERITCLLDREHQIGHSYFLKLENNKTIDKLASIFKKNIIPLLQEYFFDDYEAIKKVLGESGGFITEKDSPFGDCKKIYGIAEEMPQEAAAYQNIYEHSAIDIDN